MIVYGTRQCPDTVACLNELELSGRPFEFRDITELPMLKEFLRYRDREGMFDTVKANGGVGIPLIVKDDGNLSFEW